MDNADFNREVAQGEFEIAMTRFVRTLDAERFAGLINGAAKYRSGLRDEIASLRLLARELHQTALEHARAYGSVLPHRVGRSFIQPPASFERLGEFHGADRLYKRAVRAAKEYAEVREALVKRREQLKTLERKLRARLDDREAVLLEQLKSPRSLRIARQLDPLLDRSYQKLQALLGDFRGPSIAGGLGAV
jgi:hypothetical protein